MPENCRRPGIGQALRMSFTFVAARRSTADCASLSWRILVPPKPISANLKLCKKSLGLSGSGNVDRQSSNWAALTDFCQSGYWRRVWIIQELRMTHRVVVHRGKRTASYDRLTMLVEEAVEHWKPSKAQSLGVIRSQLTFDIRCIITLVQASVKCARDRRFSAIGICCHCKPCTATVPSQEI